LADNGPAGKQRWFRTVREKYPMSTGGGALGKGSNLPPCPISADQFQGVWIFEIERDSRRAFSNQISTACRVVRMMAAISAGK